MTIQPFDMNAFKSFIDMIKANPEAKSMMQDALREDSPRPMTESRSSMIEVDGKKQFVPDPKLVGAIPPFRELTHAQVAFYDNGENRLAKNGKKSTKIRFNLSVELWTDPGSRMSKFRPQFKRTVALRNSNAFLTKIEEQKRKGAISGDDHGFMTDVVLGMPIDQREQWLFGQIGENHVGYRFHAFQLVMFKPKPQGDGAECVFVRPNESEYETFDITDFNEQFAKGTLKYSAAMDVDGLWSPRRRSVIDSGKNG